jgi:hypothetical protein
LAPTFLFDPDPDPTTHFFTDLDPPLQQNDTLRHTFHFDADSDPAFNFDADADPDPASQNGAESLYSTVRYFSTVRYGT